MVTPVSIRFRRAEVADRLKAEAGARNVSTSALAEELIEEGLRLRRHPMIVFRDGPSGRRAGLIGGPDVWEVVGGLVGREPGTERRDLEEHAARLTEVDRTEVVSVLLFGRVLPVCPDQLLGHRSLLFVVGGNLFGNLPLVKHNFGIVTLLIVLASLVPLAVVMLRSGPAER